MTRLTSLAVNVVATFFLWLAVALTHAVTTEISAGRDTIMIIAILTAFGLTAVLWLVWALTDYSQKTPSVSEKSKRSAGEDARLSLLVQLMDEDERQALKRRLAEELSSDGEATSLAALLVGQNDKE